jgi:hypothetical protein
MVRIPVFEVAGADQKSRFVALILYIVIWAAKIVNIAQTSKVVCLFARGINIVVVGDFGM